MKEQLLIIDDDQATHNLVNHYCADGRIECVSAFDGEDGLRKALAMPPGAILLDMEMPCINGDEVCRRLKAHPRTNAVPVIFLTADTTSASKVNGIELGAADYVTKPFDPFELRARIGLALRSRLVIEAANSRAAVDALTGLWNRAFLEKRFEAEVAAARRSGRQVACCVAAIDRFDELAGKMGQPGGVDLICQTAAAIAAVVRQDDVVGRYDHHTLAVLGLVCDRQAALLLANRIRTSVGPLGILCFTEPETVTCSVGLVVSRAGTGRRVLGAAARALSEALHDDGNGTVSLSAEVADSIFDGVFVN